MNKRPLYICLEGLDGSGKTTLFKKIVKKLKEEGFTLCEVSPTQKCGENDLWEKIYDKFKFLKDIIFFRNFLYAHRSNMVTKNIDWNVDLLIGDRSIITSFMCRWSKSDLKNKKVIARVNFLESKIPTPDYAIYLDVTPENLQKRLNYRGNKVGTRMLSSFIKQMHEEAYDEIGFDCLMHNLRAKNLYHSLGFKEVAEGIGFDGTDYSTVEVVFFKRKITTFTPRDFQMMPGTNVKENDLEREKYIFDCLTKKENLNLDII